MTGDADKLIAPDRDELLGELDHNAVSAQSSLAVVFSDAAAEIRVLAHALVREQETSRELRETLDEEIQRATENGRLAQDHWERAERAEAYLRTIADSTYPARYIGRSIDGVELYGASDDASRYARAYFRTGPTQ